MSVDLAKLCGRLDLGCQIGVGAVLAANTTREVAVKDGWPRATGEKRGRYYVLGPDLLRPPAQGEIVSPSA